MLIGAFEGGELGRRDVATGDVSNEGFGHFGLGGSGAWADPSLELAIAMVCYRGGGTPVGDLRLMQLGAAAIASADRVTTTAPS